MNESFFGLYLLAFTEFLYYQHPSQLQIDNKEMSHSWYTYTLIKAIVYKNTTDYSVLHNTEGEQKEAGCDMMVNGKMSYICTCKITY